MSLLETFCGGARLEADELTCTSSLLWEGVADEGAWCMGMSLVVTPPVKVCTGPIPCHTWGQGRVSVSIGEDREVCFDSHHHYRHHR